MKEDNQRTIKIREDTYKELKAASKKEDRPMTAIIQASLDLYSIAKKIEV